MDFNFSTTKKTPIPADFVMPEIVTRDISQMPHCPYCAKGTVRSGGVSFSTAAYYAPIYDENGVNTNIDRNTTTTQYFCHNCNNGYSVATCAGESRYI